MNAAEYRDEVALQVTLFDPDTFETGPPPSPILADLRRASRERRRPARRWPVAS